MKVRLTTFTTKTQWMGQPMLAAITVKFYKHVPITETTTTKNKRKISKRDNEKGTKTKSKHHLPYNGKLLLFVCV